MDRLNYAFADGVTIAPRNVIRIRRVPELAVGALLQPMVKILMFAYVCGGSIAAVA